jgi:hypothetical protein
VWRRPSIEIAPRTLYWLYQQLSRPSQGVRRRAPSISPATQPDPSALRRGAERIERERSQLSQQRMLGRRTLSATNVNRAASAARAATRIGRESGDVDRASESVEAIQQRQKDLQQQFDADAAALETRFDATTVSLRTVQVSPRKSDIAVGEVALVWTPWRKGDGGAVIPA